MIQAEIGGAARVDPGTDVQKPGFMIRDFTLTSSGDEIIRPSSFRGRSNLVVVFPGYSDTLRVFLAELVRHGRIFSRYETTALIVVPYGPKLQGIPIPTDPPIVVLHDETLRVYRLSGAMDEKGYLVPIVYLTDRFGEIVSTYVASAQSMPPNIGEILATLEFVNHQCPECEPPEWPR